MHCRARIKRSYPRRRTHKDDASAFSRRNRKKKSCCRFMHRKFTVHPQVLHTSPVEDGRGALDDDGAKYYAGNFMKGRHLAVHGLLAVAFGVVGLLALAPASWAAGDATAFRVFLRDGSSLSSFGEFARVADRVVFSMRVGSAPDAPLHLVNLPVDRVDWERTQRYAEAARAARYIETRAETDYAGLSNDVARVLNDVVRMDDASVRLALIEDARRRLAVWPQQHYNYRDAEVRQMLGLLDEAIADLRGAERPGEFSLNLVAFAAPLPASEALLPEPDPQEALAQILTAAEAADSAPERSALLSVLLEALDRDGALLDAAWASSARTRAQAALDAERLLDRRYQSLSERIMGLAETRARRADVRGVERLLAQIRREDETLGLARPDAVDSLVAAVQERLDAARRLRLARDRWELRRPVFGEYGVAINRPMYLLAELDAPLDDIKALAGSSPSALARIERLVTRILKLTSDVTPPEEFAAAHALLVSAAHLAEAAARHRRDATLANDIARAWDASSAAAGALMLGARARTDIRTLLQPPQLP
jgi:hypothetical protein